MAKAHTLTDNFNDNTTDSSKWKIDDDGAGEAREVNQRLEVRPPPHTNDGYAGYHSAVSYDLTDSWVRVEVLRPLSVPGGNTYLRVGHSADNVRLMAVNGKLVCIQMVGGAVMTLASVPYDPVDHRWWQLREFGGTTYWEVSSDGQRWSTLFSKSIPRDLYTQVPIYLRALTNNPVPSPGVAIFGAFNAPSASPSRTASIASIRPSPPAVCCSGAHRASP